MFWLDVETKSISCDELFICSCGIFCQLNKMWIYFQSVILVMSKINCDLILHIRNPLFHDWQGDEIDIQCIHDVIELR